MKRQLTVALGLAVLATPVMASKARLEALGEDNLGSYYVNDNRNQFLNPAQINNHKDLVTFEFGSTGNATSNADAVKAPKAVGGVNKAYGNMVYGLYFGDATPSSSVVRSLSGVNLQEKNPIDLFVGGDAGVKWGANVTYDAYDGGSSATNDRLASNALRARVGVLMGDLEAFAHVSAKGDAKDFLGNEIEGKASYFVGVGQLVNGTKFFADYKHIAGEYSSVASATVKEDWKFNEARLGAGRVERLNDKANMFAKVTIERRTVEDDGKSTFSGVAGESTRYILPINLGLETEATSWLTLRASVGHNIWSQNEVDPKGGKKTSTHLANTAVRAGATLKFGELSVDGLISTNADGNTPVTQGNNDTSVSGGNGSLRTDSLMTRVAMTYRF